MNVTLLWLINEQGQFLISRRAKSMDSDPGVWGPSVSGVIEEGETADQAAIREAAEELRLELPERPVFLCDISYLHSDGIMRAFKMHYCRIAHTQITTRQLDQKEVMDIKWISLPEFIHMYHTDKQSIVSSDSDELWSTIINYLEPLTTVTI